MNILERLNIFKILRKRKQDKERVRVVVDYWVKFLENPRLSTHNCGDSVISLIADAMLTTTQIRPERILIFKKLLENKLKRYSHVWLKSDYGPEGELLSILIDAGIRNAQFPWKTSMSVSENRVVVSEGYCAPDVVLWERKN